MRKDGLFVVLDGGDGCGKSTQIGLLARAFETESPVNLVLKTFQPGGTPLGGEIRHELLHSAVELTAGQELTYFSCDRALHVANVIKPALDEGKIVVCDRWASSTWAYQGYAGGLGVETIEQFTSHATADLDPDLLIILA